MIGTSNRVLTGPVNYDHFFTHSVTRVNHCTFSAPHPKQ